MDVPVWQRVPNIHSLGDVLGYSIGMLNDLAQVEEIYSDFERLKRLRTECGFSN